MTPISGKYVLERRLGGGGMAEVFRAQTVGAEGFTRTVAIKRVVSGLAEDPRFAAMFVSEARITSKLQHPNIVSVLDFDRDEAGRPFLVMELVDGPSLDELARSGDLPLPAVVHLATEILRGLGYAHDQRVVHRDVSPHNVLLSWEGAVKISDFGIAKARAASSVTASDTIKGKPAYMSPEQANGESLDGRSDLFAVGVMLWELLCGRELFSGQSTQETLARLMFAPIPSPRELRPEVPEELADLTMRLLSRDRSERPETAADAISELVASSEHPRSGRELLIALLGERFLDRAPRRDGIASDVPTVATAKPHARLPGPLDAMRAQPPPRPDRRPLVVLGLAAIIATAVVLVLVLKTDPAPQRVAEVTVDAAALGPTVATSDAANSDATPVADPPVDPPASGDAGASEAPTKAGPTSEPTKKTGPTVEPTKPGPTSEPVKPDSTAKIDPQLKDKILASQGAGKPYTTPLAKATAVDPLAYYKTAKATAEKILGKVRPTLIRWRGFDRAGKVDVTKKDGDVDFVFAGYDTPADGHCFASITLEDGVVTITVSRPSAGGPCTGAVGTPSCTAAQLYERSIELGMPADAAQVSAFMSGNYWNMSAGEFSQAISNKTCQ
ncbi:MAG TPA: protein kinase [Kofleriaceae bacterium]